MVQVPESSQSDYSNLRINMQSGNNVKYSFETDDKKCAEILGKELVKRKKLFPTVTLIFKKKGLHLKFHMYFNISFDYTVSVCCLTVKKSDTFLCHTHLICLFVYFRLNAPFRGEGVHLRGLNKGGRLLTIFNF